MSGTGSNFTLGFGGERAIRSVSLAVYSKKVWRSNDFWVSLYYQ